MNKEVSIVLSVEKRDYRKVAQDWYGLTDEQMIGMDVHHNPARHEGGRDIPEHLYVYHNSLHSAVHGDDFVLWARAGGKLGGLSCAAKKVGAHDPITRSAAGKKGGQTNAINKTGVCGRSGEQMAEDGRKGGLATFNKKVGAFAPENRGIGGKSVSKENCVKRGKKAAETNRANKTSFFDPSIQRQGSIAAHAQKDANGKSLHAKKLGSITSSIVFEDPDHPELGHHNAGNLAKKQKALGLPHQKDNRRKIK